MAPIPSVREETVATPRPNRVGLTRRPQTGKLLEEEALAAAALRVPKLAMEKAVTATGPLRIAIDQAIMMVATEKKVFGLSQKFISIEDGKLEMGKSQGQHTEIFPRAIAALLHPSPQTKEVLT